MQAEDTIKPSVVIAEGRHGTLWLEEERRPATHKSQAINSECCLVQFRLAQINFSNSQPWHQADGNLKRQPQQSLNSSKLHQIDC